MLDHKDIQDAMRRLDELVRLSVEEDAPLFATTLRAVRASFVRSYFAAADAEDALKATQDQLHNAQTSIVHMETLLNQDLRMMAQSEAEKDLAENRASFLQRINSILARFLLDEMAVEVEVKQVGNIGHAVAKPVDLKKAAAKQGHTLVPTEALRFLYGERVDSAGKHFGDLEDAAQNAPLRRTFWWRTWLRQAIEAGAEPWMTKKQKRRKGLK